MRLFYLLFALSFDQGSALAQTTGTQVAVGTNTESSAYSRLTRAYAELRMPPIQRLQGWYSGWCATKAKPQHRYGALLTTFVSADGINKSVFWSDSKLKPTHFDQLTPAMIEEIEKGLVDWGPKIPPLLARSTYWEASFNTGSEVYSSRTRANLRGIVVLSFTNSDQTAACAFLKRVF